MSENFVDQMIADAVRDAGISPDDIQELPREVASQVVASVMEKFVEGNPRVWWLSLKRRFKVFEVDNSGDFSFLRNQWPQGEERCYFIPENDAKELKVYLATPHGIIKVLSECSFFEYNLIGCKNDWLMIETDHNELLVVRD